MCALCDHAEQQVGTVVLNRAAKYLLVGRNGRGALDTTKSVDSRPNAELSNTLDADAHRIVWTNVSRRALNRHFGEANTYGTNVAAKNITTVESLTSSDRIIQALEID